MKNILNSQIVVEGARGHWTGDHNGTLVSPTIEIYGLLPNDQPYGSITAEISRSTTDGGASTTLWSLRIPFGKYTSRLYDKVIYTGNDGGEYDSGYKVNPENRNSITTLDKVILKTPSIPNWWEVEKKVKQNLWKDEKEMCDAAGIVPYTYYLIYKGYPTLEEIDAKWQKLIELKATRMSVCKETGKLFVKTSDDKEILFSNI